MASQPADKAEIVMVDDRSFENNREDTEKAPNIHTIDNIRVLGLSDDDANFYSNMSEADRKIITRKVRAYQDSR